jgi:monothiol glutaredoxin
MPRHILDEQKIHQNIKEKIATHNQGIVTEVQNAVRDNNIVIVGMAINPNPKRARKVLDDKGITYKYLEYGSYFSEWRPRTALKMWTGWPTFPMIFVKGTFIGGADDLEKLIQSGELQQMLKE